jgi:glycosyltransferase involved in cell wall biosynthesis
MIFVAKLSYYSLLCPYTIINLIVTILKIAVNTRLLIKNKLEGIGWFTTETLRRITSNNPEVQFYFIFDRKHDPEFIFSSNITPIETGPQARHPLLFYLWFEYSIPRILKKIKPDLFLSPDGYLSLVTKTKSLAVIHDLNFEYYPEDLPYLTRKYYTTFFPKFAKKATRIATVSEYSKKDISQLYHIDPEKIDVVFNGANENFTPIDEDAKLQVRNKYTNGKPYFIFVGALHPRKNLSNLFKAYDLFREKTSSDTKLVIAGAKKWWTSHMQQVYNNMKYNQDIIFTGRVQADELNLLLGSALAMTYVSYFEGFGIPIMEAFYCGVPVITSNTTSMPEVAGDAAMIIDPFSAESIAESMVTISKDENLRKELVRKGNTRKNKFTWQKSADRLWESVVKTITN